MSVCAGYRSSGRQSPVKRTIPLFRPLCTTEKPPKLWFSSALQSLNDKTPQQQQQQHHHHKQRMAPPPPPPPPLPPRGGTDQQQQQRKSLTSRWLESKQDSDEESVASAAEYNSVASATEYNVAEQQQHQHMSTTNTISTNFGVGSCHSTKPYGDNEIIDEQTRRSLETMSVVKEEPEEETEDIGSVRLLSRRTLEDDNGIVHRSDFLKQDSDEESVASAAEYNVAEQQQQHHHMASTNTVSTNFGVGSCHSTKPYGDNEIIDEQTRRSLETMSVVKEEPEEETEDIGSVRLLSRRTLEDDNGIVHRSDFLKSNYPYESSESDEDDHPNAHLAAYGIHRLGIYEALQKVQDEKINVSGFGGKTTIFNSSLIKFVMKTDIGPKELFANSTQQIATTVPVVYGVPGKPMEVNISYKTPDVLIGMDYFMEFITSLEKAGQDVYIVNSVVGKMICKSMPQLQTNTVTSLAIESQTFDEDESNLKKFWNLEDMGIKDSENNDEEAKILEKFKKNVKFENHRYFVSWPEKENHEELPSNAGLALGRMKSMFKRLSSDPKLLDDCDKIVKDQHAREVIEIAPEIPEGHLVHYLSPQAVITPQKITTKIRMVFDASAKISKFAPCLNDCFIRGPLNMPDLSGILLRFRRGKYVLVGDIEKAFHTIYLNKESRDSVRFFWVKDISKPITNDNLIIYRFIGVPFGVISSPFILWSIIMLHLQKLEDENLRHIDENFYVDNITLLVDDETEGVNQFTKIRNHFLDASMNIREWLSNSPKINHAIPEEIRQQNTTTKILGLNWNSVADSLQIEMKQFSGTENWTKRKILKFIASTFDPLGFLSPVTVKGRVFMQKLFREKVQWDELLKDKLLNEWKKIFKDWNGIIEVARKYVEDKFPDAENVEMHSFADASPDAYCAVIYLRIKTENGIETVLVFAKVRLQPLNKKLTIPQIEVMGIWLAAKMIIYVAKQLKLESCKKYIWTDSKIAYHWIKKFPKDVFVTNRLKEVLKCNATCYFVPGILNPADLGTRGITFEQLKNAEC
uniref:Reverse transcriptase domain-containing protein n=1 Tax=Panagrolaimus sp. PS1159 TaxID=55785 RepID=A0AC35FKR7_9BILA